MKLLTLNLHCFAEDNIVTNQSVIVDFIITRDIDVCFFQEVAQHFESALYINKIKVDNYALILQRKLSDLGHTYYLHYDYSKRGYGVYDEGLAILSKTPFSSTTSYHVSNKIDYHDWHTRMNVSCETLINNTVFSFTSLHLGWTEGNEVFEDQLDKTLCQLDNKNINILAGDFNVSEDSKEYKYITSKGLNDLYYSGDKKYFSDVTHQPYIDVKKEAKRIDYFFSNKKFKVIDREIVFNDYLVSDHYGVYINIEVNENEIN